MAYLGRQPVLGNFVKLDAISVVNGQAAYTMQNGSVNFTDYSTVNQFLVSLNGTIQSPGSSFTVNSSTITFSSNLSTGDVIDFIIVFGNSLSAGTVADGSITSAKLASGVGGVAGITSSADATAITIDSSERVGIGTSSPSTPLHTLTTDGGNVDENLTITNASTTSGTGSRIRFVSSTDISSAPNSVSISSYRNAGSDHDLLFESSNAEKMRILSNGSIKLTNTPPIKTFDLGTTATVTLADGAHIEFTSTSGVWFVTEQSQTGLSAILLAGGGQTSVASQIGSSYTNSSSSGSFRWYRPSGQGYYFKNDQGNTCTFGICHISLRNSN